MKTQLPVNWGDIKVAMIIPAYKAEDTIQRVVSGVPDFVRWIIIVNDCSPDDTYLAAKACEDERVVLVDLDKNRGVGGATLQGYKTACDLGADLFVKMDSDGQMDPAYLAALLIPLLEDEADYTKGNRFVHLRKLEAMPVVRRIGNLGLSFLNKLASGYWSVFDPTNGYTAITRETYLKLDLENIHWRYFFESSMLIELSMQRAVIVDVPIPAHYADEKSSLSVLDSLLRFPILLLRGAFKRILIQYFIRDFSAFALFFSLGSVLFAWGLIFGLMKWYESSRTHTATNTGTVMVAVIPFILGVQFLLQALLLDVQNVPAARQRK